MAAIKYYTDEHVARAIVNGLRQRGIDVLSVVEAGMLGATDEDHLFLAQQLLRVIFTQDDDFLKLHASGLSHAGIVYARQGAQLGELLRGLVLIHQVLDSEEMKNHVEFL